MRKRMSLTARRELLESDRQRYQKGNRKEKGRILDEIVAATGYHRKHVIAALQKNPPPARTSRTRQPRVYTEEVRKTIMKVWQASNRLCARRLAPFLAEFVPILERKGYLQLTEEMREKVLGISPATIDRILAAVDRRRGVKTAKSGALIKHQIPIRTFNEWDDRRPGFLEADLVAHCGTTVSGSYLNTLTLTDVATGWTECFALLTRSQDGVTHALERGLEVFPFPILGLDTDNGSEFMNGELIAFCKTRGITFTRSRPYRKNDQCFVEQKNGSVVRRLIGYDRFEGAAACRQLAELHGIVRLHVNFFQPSMKLMGKERVGSRVKKKYDAARTPCQRLLASPDIPAETKDRLIQQYTQLDPVEILHRLGQLQNSLWQYAGMIEGSGLVSPDPRLKRIPEKAKSPAALLVAAESPVEINRSSPKAGRYHLVAHTWRTRPDPFVLVWEEVTARLEANPQLTARELFLICQATYPGHFPDGQLRTLQRRVKAWRKEKLMEIPVLIDCPLPAPGESEENHPPRTP